MRVPKMNERIRDGEIIISILEQYCPLPLLELELLQNTVLTKKVLYHGIPVSCLWNREPLRVLNDTNLILSE